MSGNKEMTGINRNLGQNWISRKKLEKENATKMDFQKKTGKKKLAGS